MEFRILGPLDVTRDGVPVPIKGRHQPRLLAALLLEPGRTVTSSRLVEVLWEDEPPDTARRQVQNYMAALRRGLGPESIASVGDGYRLVVDAATVDALRFEKLLEQARTAAREGDLAAASKRFDEALGLWRGSALMGLPGRAIQAAAARWEERRLAAVEECAEAKLALGHHAEVVPQLREVLREQPFRQRVAGQLMLALYRCGRESEALEVYEGLRERLTGELGIDPDSTMRDLNERISRDDAALRATGTARSTTARTDLPVPAQLPADVSTFTGRHEHLDALDGLLESGGDVAVVSAISGGGGVGKTALAVHWGHRNRDRFPDGQLYVDLRGFSHTEPVTPLDALSRFLRALGVPGAKIPTDAEEAAALYRSRLAGRRVLVILDNARTVEQVRPLVPNGGKLVVTSRNLLSSLSVFADATIIGLDTLNIEESLDLLITLLGAERVRADRDSATRLAELCGRLPLALRIAAANVAGRPELSLAEFVSGMDSPARMEFLEVDGDPRSAVAATFELSVDALDSETSELFLRLGLIPGADFSESLALAVSGLSDEQARLSLRRLVTAHLLESHAAGRYRFHDLLRAFVSHRADGTISATEREAVHTEITDWYFRDRGGLGPGDIPNTISTCEVLHDHPQLWMVAYALSLITHHGLGLEVAREHCQNAMRVATEHGDGHGHARMLSALAGIHYTLGQTRSSIELSYRAVAAVDPEADRRTHADMCNNLGIRLSWSGRYLEAEKWLLKSLLPRQHSEGIRFDLVRLLNLTTVYRASGRFAQAEAYLERTAALLPGIDNMSVSASVSIAGALLDNDRGRYGHARLLAQEALVKGRQCTSIRSIVLGYQQRGLAEWGLGEVERARADFLESAARAREHAMATMERRDWCFLAELECRAGNPGRAREHLATAAAVEVVQPPPYLVAELLRVGAAVQVAVGEFAAAVSSADRAVELFTTMPDPLRNARTLTVLADAHDGLGHHSQAEQYQRDALTVFTGLGVAEAGMVKAKLDARPR